MISAASLLHQNNALSLIYPTGCLVQNIKTVMFYALATKFGLKAKFCGLGIGLVIGWLCLWPYRLFGLG